MFLNSIPVIGHVKGVVHYVKGDKEKGRRAICEATRTAVVIGGGVVGAVAGPAGAAFVAAAGGAILDSVATIATKEPVGICGNINSIVADIRNGKPPIATALGAGVAVGADLLSGVTAGALTSATAKGAGSSAGKKIAKSFGKALKKTLCKKTLKKEIGRKALTVGAAVAEAAVTHIQSLSPRHEQLAAKPPVLYPGDDANLSSPITSPNKRNRPFACDIRNDSDPDKSRDRSLNDSGGSGIRSPDGNRRKIKKRCSLKMTKSFETFRKTICEESLRDICIEGDYVFKDLGYGEQRSFSTHINNLKRNGYDADRVIKITTELFKNVHSPGEEMDYKNFLLEMNFVASFIGEQVDRLNNLRNHDEETFKEILADGPSANERLRMLADIVTTNLLSPGAATALKDVTIDYIVSTFKTIQSWITEIVIQPGFKNVYSAVCNYYINRYIPEHNRHLSVSEYFDIIRFLLDDVIETRDYERLRKGEIPDMQIEILMDDLGKAKIVLKYEHGQVIIASVLFSY